MTPRTHPVHAFLGPSAQRARDRFVSACAVLVLVPGGLFASEARLCAVTTAYFDFPGPVPADLTAVVSAMSDVNTASNAFDEDAFARGVHLLRLALAEYFAKEVVV